MLPSKKNIVKALDDSTNILDQHLNGYVCEICNNPKSVFNGKKLMRSGSYGIVFPMLKGNQRAAFKVWYTELDEIERRLQEINH